MPRVLKVLSTLILALAVTSAAAAQDLPAKYNQPIALDAIDIGRFDAAVRFYSNIERQRYGRTPLAPDAKLLRAATDHARNMAELKTHSHQLPIRGQSRLVQRMDRVSLRYRTAGENIAQDKVLRSHGKVPVKVHHWSGICFLQSCTDKDPGSEPGCMTRLVRRA